MRNQGYLPVKLKFEKGDQYGEISPETGKPKRSARVKAKHIFLAHNAYFHFSYFRFTQKALKNGFTQNEIDNLDRLTHSYWLAQSFARPGGCVWGKPGCKSVGIITILGYLNEKNESLEAVMRITDIGHFKRKKTVNIAVRTAAAITALDTMMAKYADQLAMEKKEEYLKALEERIYDDN